MNKGRRQELTRLKYIKRIKHIGAISKDAKLFIFKSHGKPCSCWACRDPKYRETSRNGEAMIARKEVENFYIDPIRDEEIWVDNLIEEL